MKVFVLSPPQSPRRQHYENDPRYTLMGDLWKTDINIDEYKDKWIFRWNTKDEKRKSVLSHIVNYMSILERIRDENLTDCFILEDDADLDFTRIPEFLDTIKEIDNTLIYVGGIISGAKPSDTKSLSIKPIINPQVGINFINNTDFSIMGCFGLFIKNAGVADELVKRLYKRRRPTLDISLSKIDYPSAFYFPALSTLRDTPSILYKGNINGKLGNCLYYKISMGH